MTLFPLCICPESIGIYKRYPAFENAGYRFSWRLLPFRDLVI